MDYWTIEEITSSKTCRHKKYVHNKLFRFTAVLCLYGDNQECKKEICPLRVGKGER